MRARGLERETLFRAPFLARARLSRGQSLEIVLATRNRKKVEEFGRILAQSGLTLRSLDEFPDCPDVVEDQETFEGNAVKKARIVAAHTGLAAVADDSGSRWTPWAAPRAFSRPAGPVPGADNRQNREKLLAELRGRPRRTPGRKVRLLYRPGLSGWKGRDLLRSSGRANRGGAPGRERVPVRSSLLSGRARPNLRGDGREKRRTP